MLARSPPSIPSRPSHRPSAGHDDNEDAAESFAELLRLDGHEVEAAKSPADALQRIKPFSPDVTLIDIGLPRDEWLRTAATFAIASTLSKMRFLAVTGYGRTEYRNRTRQAGFDNHLVKPVSLPALTRALVRNDPGYKR